MSKYRRLDEQKIAQTLSRLRDRITERFPGSGLSHVADELRSLGAETTELVEYVKRPHWPIRIGAGMAIAAMLVILVVVLSYLPIADRAIGYTDFVQAMDAALSTLVFLGASLFFLTTLENRIKRHKALAPCPRTHRVRAGPLPRLLQRAALGHQQTRRAARAAFPRLRGPGRGQRDRNPHHRAVGEDLAEDHAAGPGSAVNPFLAAALF